DRLNHNAGGGEMSTTGGIFPLLLIFSNGRKQSLVSGPVFDEDLFEHSNVFVPVSRADGGKGQPQHVGGFVWIVGLHLDHKLADVAEPLDLSEDILILRLGV